MDRLATPRLAPPAPPRPDHPLSLREFLRTIRTNALMIWPTAAYRQDALVRRFVGRNNILVNTPDAIHQVLVANPGNYRRTAASIRILRPITGKGLLLSEGERWRLQRRTIAPALAPRVLPTLCPHIATATRETMTLIDAQARGQAARGQTASGQAATGPTADGQTAGAAVDLLAAMRDLALDIAGRTMFSLEMRDHGAAMRRMLNEFAVSHARPRLLDMILPANLPSFGDLGRRRFQTRWMGLIETIMRPRLAEPVPEIPRDLFDLLRAARDPETGAGFTAPELRDQVATMILAGHETTAVALFWTLTLLAQSPFHQDLVAREVGGLDLSPTTAHAALAGLPYTRAVIHEALRLYPPAFTIVREAMGPDLLPDIRLSGNRAASLRVHRHDVIMIAPWVLHRHEAFWPDPDAFDPTRFLPGAPAPPRFAYLPFGAGPRICVGAQFALTEASIALASLIQRFSVSLAERRPVLPVAVVTTQPDHAPLFRVIPRAILRP